MLSLAFDILIGFLVVSVYPIFGISRPLSISPVVITYAVAITFLCLVAWRRSHDYSFPIRFCSNRFYLFKIGLLLSLPIIAALGAEFVNFRANNIFLLMFTLIIAILPLLAMWRKFIPSSLYPLAIFMISISILLSVSLVSNYLWGWDIQREYQMYRSTEAFSVWPPINVATTYDATLSITILPAIITRFTGLGGLPIFKVVFPVLSGLFPLITYELFQKYISKKAAFLSALIVAFQFTYLSMPQMAKQELGSIFLAAVVMSFVLEDNALLVKLCPIFIMAAVLSHYGTAYLLVIVLPIAGVILALRKERNWRSTISLSLLTFISTIGWYMYASGSIVFSTLVKMVSDFANSFLMGFSGFGATYALDLVNRGELTFARSALKYQYIALQLFIVIGFLICFAGFLRRKRIVFPDKFMAISTAFMGLFVAEIIIPQFGVYADINRMFFLSTLVLSSFCLIGVFAIFNSVNKVKSYIPIKSSNISHLRIKKMPAKLKGFELTLLAVFLCIFFLLSSGFISEVTKDAYPLSFALSGERMHFPAYDMEEVRGAAWLINGVPERSLVYCDKIAAQVFIGLSPVGQKYDIQSFATDNTGQLTIPSQSITGSYIYLRHINLESGEYDVAISVSRTLFVTKTISLSNMTIIQHAFIIGNIIFENGQSEIILIP
jgi:uncharacterized membrane protein